MSKWKKVIPRAMREVMADTAIGDVSKTRLIVKVKETDSVQTVLETLNKHQVRSVVVCDESSQPTGIADMLDILVFMLNVICVEDEEGMVNAPKLEHIGTQKFQSVRFHFGNIRSALDLVSRGAYLPVKADASILNCFTNQKNVIDFNKVHRLPVVDPESDKLRKIVTQASILRWIVSTKISFPHGDTSIQNTVRFERLPFVVSTTDPALTSLRAMVAAHKRSAAVVDAAGRFASRLSVDDLQGLTMETFHRLFLPVMTFLAEMRTTQSVPPTTVASPDITLNELVSIFIESSTHQVYLVNKSGFCVGVVALAHVLAAIMSPTKTRLLIAADREKSRERRNRTGASGRYGGRGHVRTYSTSAHTSPIARTARSSTDSDPGNGRSPGRPLRRSTESDSGHGRSNGIRPWTSLENS